MTFIPIESIIDNPRLAGSPYDKIRPAQADALRTIVASSHKSIVIEAPTGVGKSFIPAALGANDYVTVLVHTLNLGNQYKDEYGFDFLPGRQNFECVVPEKREDFARKGMGLPTAHDCQFSDMHDCEYSARCPYLIAKDRAKGAKRLVVTYPYAMLSRMVQERSGILVADEAHSVVDALLNFTDTEVSEVIRRRYNLPLFPYQSQAYGERGKGGIATPVARRIVGNWMRSAIESLDGQLRNEEFLTTPEDAAKVKLRRRLQLTVESINQGDWFLACGPLAVEVTEKGRKLDAPGIKLKSLSVKEAYPTLLGKKDKAVFMSATLGKAELITESLGIDDYEWRSYPHPVSVEKRPIFDMGLERMTAANISKYPNLLRDQGRSICKQIINEIDPEWRGLIVSTSNEKIRILYEVLHSFPELRGRIIELSGSVQERTNQYLRDTRKGGVAVGTMQGMGVGLNLSGDRARYMVIAGTPHPSPMDAFYNALKQLPWGRAFLTRTTYNAIQQADGRAKRGDLDPATGDYQYNETYIADGGATTEQAKAEYSNWFNSAIFPIDKRKDMCYNVLKLAGGE